MHVFALHVPTQDENLPLLLLTKSTTSTTTTAAVIPVPWRRLQQLEMLYQRVGGRPTAAAATSTSTTIMNNINFYSFYHYFITICLASLVASRNAFLLITPSWSFQKLKQKSIIAKAIF